ncbi:uncharacterized protein LOC117964996 isoform X1 [Acipenser ruthenus]|uniref:uncharacterized protein LOC117964996 isoform X1 n=1 Tax=Acipenser ruthenus TaxID=7906 RepID=UPI002742043C|nr:uncharacterized protein LOC117964996 isoform X1 [Acipenser ruthenus]
MRTLLALTVLPWLTLSSNTVKNITVSPETEVDFKCNATALPVRWIWFPKHCKCAEESSMKIIYTIDMHGNKTTVQRFKKRLTLRGDPRAGEHALVLSDSVMSDSGTYTCADSKTIVQRYELEVTAGCYHNVQIEIRSGKEAEGVTLSCSSCAGGKQIKNLKWTFNGKPVSDLHGIRQTRNLITIQKVTTDDEGKWICASVDDPFQFSEYCLDFGSKTGRKNNENKYPKDTTQATGLNKNDSETDGKGGLSDALKAVIVVALVLIVMVLLTSVWLYLYRRKRSRRLEQKLTDNSAPNGDFSPPVSVVTGQAMTGTATQQEEVEVQYASINLGQTKRQQRPLSVEESTVYSAVKIK